jgi:hypothetical protein
MTRRRSENLTHGSPYLQALSTMRRGEDARNKPHDDEEFPLYLRKKAMIRCACRHHSHGHTSTAHTHHVHKTVFTP